MAFLDPAIILKLAMTRLETVSSVLAALYFGEREGTTDDDQVVARTEAMSWTRTERQMPAAALDAPDHAEFTLRVRLQVSDTQGEASVLSGAAMLAHVEQAFRETHEPDAGSNHRVHFVNTEAMLETTTAGGTTGGTVTITGHAQRTAGTTIFSPP